MLNIRPGLKFCKEVSFNLYLGFLLQLSHWAIPEKSKQEITCGNSRGDQARKNHVEFPWVLVFGLGISKRSVASNSNSAFIFSGTQDINVFINDENILYNLSSSLKTLKTKNSKRLVFGNLNINTKNNKFEQLSKYIGYN